MEAPPKTAGRGQIDAVPFQASVPRKRLRAVRGWPRRVPSLQGYRPTTYQAVQLVRCVRPGPGDRGTTPRLVPPRRFPKCRGEGIAQPRVEERSQAHARRRRSHRRGHTGIRVRISRGYVPDIHRRGRCGVERGRERCDSRRNKRNKRRSRRTRRSRLATPCSAPSRRWSRPPPRCRRAFWRTAARSSWRSPRAPRARRPRPAAVDARDGAEARDPADPPQVAQQDHAHGDDHLHHLHRDAES